MLVTVAVALGALWYRSGDKTDILCVFVGGDAKGQVLASSGGRFLVALSNVGGGRERAWTCLHMSESSNAEQFAQMLDLNRLNAHPPVSVPARTASPVTGTAHGFSLATSQAGVLPAIPSSKLVYVTFPHWAAMATLLAWAVWRPFTSTARKHRRLSKGQCANCGYDLRASPERCPECGAVRSPIGSTPSQAPA